MDIVDIDKVLDDFELNEDNGYDFDNERKSDRIMDPIRVNESTTPIPPRNNQQCSSTVSTKFVNVSNVFHSLNEYVNAGVESKIPHYAEEQFDEASTSTSISPNSESKTRFVYEKSLLSGSFMTTSSSSSTESSTTDLSPRSITSSVSLIRNSPSLTNDEDLYKDNSNPIHDVLDVDISVEPKTTNDNNDEPLEIAENGFSSVSSMCLNEQVSTSHSSYSQDIVSSESSSLSPLNPIKDENTDQPNEKVIVAENEPTQEFQCSPMLPKKPIGFESTMDDVSDTELESYLQELELEPVLNDATANSENVVVNKVDNIPECEKTIEVFPNRIADDNGGEDRNQQNADSFSQASTIEFADMRLHSDFEQLPSVENVRAAKVEVIDAQCTIPRGQEEDLSEAEVAVEGQDPCPYEKPLQRPNSLDLAVKVIVENECHADVADQTPTEQVEA